MINGNDDDRQVVFKKQLKRFVADELSSFLRLFVFYFYFALDD